MKYALRFLSGIKSAMTRRLWPSTPYQPDFRQIGVLERLAVEPAGATGDAGKAGTTGQEDRAVAFFEQIAAAAGFLAVDEVPAVVDGYRQSKPLWCQTLLTEAQQYCRAGLPVYEVRAPCLGDPALWAQPVEKARGDRLYQLRPHRFGFLPRLAIAGSLGADTQRPLLAALDQWIAYVEKTGGADDAYFSNLVVIHRLLAISWASPFLAAAAKDGDRTAAKAFLRLFQILAADLRYLQPRLGSSVANNHLLADRFAAWFLANCYPTMLPQGSGHDLERIWQDELARQFQADGTNFEQSLHYHEFGCEMALAYLVVSLRRGVRPTEQVLTLIRQMLRFQAVASDRHGYGFPLGDATNDPILPLDPGAGTLACGAWRMLYKALFDPDFSAGEEGAEGAERAYWLLTTLRTCELPLRLTRPPAQIRDLEFFADNGYVLFGGGSDAQTFLFRSGPRAGVAIYPGHAMADLLSVYWRARGQPVLEVSGTYTYNDDSAMPVRGPAQARDYFRSPAAHNGIVLNGHDPLGWPSGRFRGSDNGTRVTTSGRGLTRSLLWAEGRLDEAGPLNGYRRGVLQVFGHYWLVYDRLPPLPADAEVSCRWQLAPEAEVAVHAERQASIVLPGLSAYLSASAGLGRPERVSGRSEPPGGWVSRGYGQLQAAPQLIFPCLPGQPNLAFVLGLTTDGHLQSTIDVVASDGEGLLLEVRQDKDLAVVCLGRLANASAYLPFDLSFQGDVLWLDFDGGFCRELRALGVRRIESKALGLDLCERGAVSPAEDWDILVEDMADGTYCGRWKRRSDG